MSTAVPENPTTAFLTGRFELPAGLAGQIGRLFVELSAPPDPNTMLPNFIDSTVWLDRIDRLKGLVVGMGVACIGYASLGMLDNPLSWEMYVAAAFVGAGEMSSNISATSLIGKEAPDHGRGAVLGLFSLFGAVGIMAVGLAGGWLFDNWRPVGPFLYMAASNGLLVLIALLMLATRTGAPATLKA